MKRSAKPVKRATALQCWPFDLSIGFQPALSAGLPPASAGWRVESRLDLGFRLRLHPRLHSAARIRGLKRARHRYADISIPLLRLFFNHFTPWANFRRASGATERFSKRSGHLRLQELSFDTIN